MLRTPRLIDGLGAWHFVLEPKVCSVFLIPGAKDKNGDERLVVLNRPASSVIDSVRGEHEEYIFAYRRRSIGTDLPGFFGPFVT